MTLSKVEHAQSDWDDERVEELALAQSAQASSVLDEEAWEDAVDESGIDCTMLCHSQWRSSMPASGD